MSHNADYVRLINSVRWRRCREEQLRRHPLCQMCEEQGRLRLAEEVHHVKPVESVAGYQDMEALAYDPYNLMSLCSECHHKIHEEMRSHSKAAARKSAERKTKMFLDKFLGGEKDMG